ncbi:AMP-binding protein [Paraburkholderia heleia]|uniref:AMP-binding protein n=1 Tax=Paraburkholderia heleia TaxID=634127 RepID=UPI0031D5D235
MDISGRTIPWQNLDQLIREKAAKHGDKVFAVIDGEDLTFRDLEVTSRKVAFRLLSKGIKKGDRVSTLLFNCTELIITWFGVARMGGIWTPLNSGLVGADLEHTLRDSGAKILVTDTEGLAKIERLDPELRHQFSTYCIDGGQRGYASFAELLVGQDADQPLPVVAAGDPAVILYTGGTTGLPKGVVLSSISLIYAGIRYGEAFEVRPNERHFTTLPLFHAIAVQMALIGPLMYDMTTVIDRRFSASNYWQRVRETRANVIDPIGAMLTMLCQQPEHAQDAQHDVRVAIGVWNQIPAEIPVLFKQRFGVPMVDVYGLSEGGGALITTNRLSDYTAGSNGKCHGWYDIAIADEHGIPVPTGEVGELLLRPLYPHLCMIGYHNAPQKTLESFRDLWLHTGDLARIDAEGNMFFAGRMAHWIRRRSENISAYEIEAVLRNHPAIAEVVVVGVQAEIGEDDIKAFIIPIEGDRPIASEIVSWCREKLAAFKIPRYIEFIDAFPRSLAKGEIERGVLKKMSHDNAWDRERGESEATRKSIR